MTALAFVDTETLGLDPDRHPIWEIAVIRATHHHDDQTLDVEDRWSATIQLPDGALARADSYALKIGRFHDRYGGDQHISRETAAQMVEVYTRGRHMVGAVPSFDALRLDALLRTHDLCPMWHYHLIDVEALAAGYLARNAIGSVCEDPNDEARAISSPPWRSDDLTAELDVTVAEDLRHTALGDADWAMRTYAAVYQLTIQETP